MTMRDADTKQSVQSILNQCIEIKWFVKIVIAAGAQLAVTLLHIWMNRGDLIEPELTTGEANLWSLS